MRRTEGTRRAQFLAGMASAGLAAAVLPAGLDRAAHRGLRHHGVVYTVGAGETYFPDKADCARESSRHLRWGKQLAPSSAPAPTLGVPEAGGMGWGVVDHDKEPGEIKGDLVRSERTQEVHLGHLLDVFSSMGLYAAMAFEFVNPGAPHRPDDPHHPDVPHCPDAPHRPDAPRYDLDMASYAITRTLKDRPDDPASGWHWRMPKEAFHALATRPVPGGPARGRARMAGRAWTGGRAWPGGRALDSEPGVDRGSAVDRGPGGCAPGRRVACSEDRPARRAAAAGPGPHDAGMAGARPPTAGRTAGPSAGRLCAEAKKQRHRCASGRMPERIRRCTAGDDTRPKLHRSFS
ncbi:hypothetical protein [Streptomyces sp. PBH53]|uniref:hypothetical protein n=1 Tax=Streptomyces sp. PBH53 TaxID=1577075 RepID=UPI000AC3EACB